MLALALTQRFPKNHCIYDGWERIASPIIRCPKNCHVCKLALGARPASASPVIARAQAARSLPFTTTFIFGKAPTAFTTLMAIRRFVAKLAACEANYSYTKTATFLGALEAIRRFVAGFAACVATFAATSLCLRKGFAGAFALSFSSMAPALSLSAPLARCGPFLEERLDHHDLYAWPGRN